MRPPIFKLEPPIKYSETTLATNEHLLEIPNLAPKEWVSLHTMWPQWPQNVLYVRSDHGHAEPIPFMLQRVAPRWYAALLAFAIGVDGVASDASRDDRPARPGEVWPFAIVPGAGLVRMRYPGRGRLWMGAAAVSVFLLQANAIVPAELQFYGSFGGLPPPRPRGAALIPLALGLVVWLASLLDTQQKLRLEQNADARYATATALSPGTDPTRRVR